MHTTSPTGTNPAVSFRFAGREDCALLLRFIRGLAEYEHMENDVVATEELLAHWLFEEHAAQAMFALLDGQEVGFALFFTNFSTFLGRAGLYLEDLFVFPQYRGRGVGTAMLRKLAQICIERGYGRFEWSCLNWNAPSIAFYRSFGAQPMDEWTTYRLDGEALAHLANAE